MNGKFVILGIILVFVVLTISLVITQHLELQKQNESNIIKTISNDPIKEKQPQDIQNSYNDSNPNPTSNLSSINDEFDPKIVELAKKAINETNYFPNTILKLCKNVRSFSDYREFLIKSGITGNNLAEAMEATEEYLKFLETNGYGKQSEIEPLIKETRDLSLKVDQCVNELIEKYKQEGQIFSGLYCKQDEYGFVKMTGRYTNGPDAYSTIYFKLGVLDDQERIVATGIGSVNDVGPYQTKMFDASAEWNGSYKECNIEVDTAYP